jgi:predicted lipoprotein with Yx(FWY)xxD motif
MIRRVAPAVVLAVLTLTAVACGDDDSAEPAASPAPTAPATATERAATAATAPTETTPITAAGTADDSADTTEETTAPTGGSDAAAVTTTRTVYGRILTLDDFTLYGFTNDERGAGTSVCNDECAAAWPPVPADTPVDDTITGEVTTVVRDDGSEQLAIGGWPVYFYTPDEPGTTDGQGVNDVWFVVGADGELVMSAETTEGY